MSTTIVAVIPTLGKDIARLNRAIRSVKRFSSNQPLRIVVVNNSIKTRLTGLLPVDEVISPGMNLGYVGALEFVRRHVTADFLWSIQDDMTLLNDVLGRLLPWFEAEPRLAVASPVLVRDKVVPARTRAGIFANKRRTTWLNIPVEDVAPEDFQVPADLCFVAGSGALFRLSALGEVGGFNVALFPLMHVDVDICGRLLERGWQLRLETKAHIAHEIGGSTPRPLARILDRLNRQVVENDLIARSSKKLSKSETVIDSRVTAIDDDIVLAISRKASRLVIDLAQETNEQLDTQKNQIVRLRKHRDALLAENGVLRQELDAMVASKSWRLTAPLRAFFRWLRK